MEETSTVDFPAGVHRLGLAEPAVRELIALRDAGDCAGVQRRMGELIGSRLVQVQAELDGVLAEQAARGGVTGGAEPIITGVGLTREVARLQAAAEILGTPYGDGGCTDDCACTGAATATVGAYRFPDASIVCTLDADGGDMTARVDEWRAVLADATGREQTDEGIALTFRHDIARTAELARLLAAEYACCSFASYHLTIDDRGVRIEVRTPPEARPALAAVFG
jgi:hypothetical protein